MKFKVHPAIPTGLFLASFFCFFVPIIMISGWLISCIGFGFASDECDKKDKWFILESKSAQEEK